MDGHARTGNRHYPEQTVFFNAWIEIMDLVAELAARARCEDIQSYHRKGAGMLAVVGTDEDPLHKA